MLRDVVPPDRLRPIAVGAQRFAQADQVDVQVRSILFGADVIHPRRAIVRRHRFERHMQRRLPVDLDPRTTIRGSGCTICRLRPPHRGSSASASSKLAGRPLSAQARSLRRVYPRLATQGLLPVSVRPFLTSRLHLPAPLSGPASGRPAGMLLSTGVTRLPRYYEYSDSCVGVVAFYDLHTPLARHAGLSASRASPSRLSVSNHLAVPGIALTPDLQRPGLPARHGSGLRQSIGGSPIDTAESSSSPTDCSFASGCSPRLLAAHAVASGFRMAGSPRVDLHLPDKARSRTHDGRHAAGHDGAG
jgi:hypothetical protein